MTRPTKRLRNSIIAEGTQRSMGVFTRPATRRRPRPRGSEPEPVRRDSAFARPRFPGRPAVAPLPDHRADGCRASTHAVSPSATTTADGSSSPPADQGSATTGTPAAMASRILMGTPDPLGHGGDGHPCPAQETPEIIDIAVDLDPRPRREPSNGRGGAGAGQNPARRGHAIAQLRPDPVGKPQGGANGRSIAQIPRQENGRLADPTGSGAADLRTSGDRNDHPPRPRAQSPQIPSAHRGGQRGARDQLGLPPTAALGLEAVGRSDQRPGKTTPPARSGGPCNRWRRRSPAAPGSHPRIASAAQPQRTIWTTATSGRQSPTASATSSLAPPPKRRVPPGPVDPGQRRATHPSSSPTRLRAEAGARPPIEHRSSTPRPPTGR